MGRRLLLNRQIGHRMNALHRPVETAAESGLLFQRFAENLTAAKLELR